MPGADGRGGGEIAALVERVHDQRAVRAAGGASGVRREERFTFALGGVLVGGFLDVLAWERGDRALVVDYKSDRLEGADPARSSGARTRLSA